MIGPTDRRAGERTGGPDGRADRRTERTDRRQAGRTGGRDGQADQRTDWPAGGQTDRRPDGTD